jgi:hypothetical protein
VLVLEQHRRGAERVQAEEGARGQERERDQQHAGVTAAVGRLPRRVGEHEQARAHAQEQHEVDLVVAPVGIELLAQHERDEPDERQQRRDDPGEDGQRLGTAFGRSEGLLP